DGSAVVGQLVHDLEIFQLGQGEQVGAVAFQGGGVAAGDQRHALGRGNTHFAAQGAHGVDLGLELDDLLLCVFVDLGRVGDGVGLDADAGGLRGAAPTGGDGDGLP